MSLDEIRTRAERMGTRGADMRTAILDAEDRLGRAMTAPEHQAFLTGWKASSGDRSERDRLRDMAAAASLRAATTID